MARMRFRDWMIENLDEQQICELAQHGADAGWPGLTYYSDTTRLYELYKDDIWDALYDDSESFGQTILEMIAGFGAANTVTSSHSFENLLVWYMAEREAQGLCDE